MEWQGAPIWVCTQTGHVVTPPSLFYLTENPSVPISTCNLCSPEVMSAPTAHIIIAHQRS